LERQVEFMETHASVAAVGGAVDVINARGESILTYANPTEDCDIRRRLVEECALWHPTVLMRRDAFVAVHGYRNVVLDAEDYDLWLRMADRYQLANLPAVILKYRMHANQVSVRKCAQQAFSCLAL